MILLTLEGTSLRYCAMLRCMISGQILWICYVVCSKVNSSFERSNYTAFSLFALIGGEPHTLLDLGSGVGEGWLLWHIRNPTETGRKNKSTKTAKEKNVKRNKKNKSE